MEFRCGLKDIIWWLPAKWLYVLKLFQKEYSSFFFKNNQQKINFHYYS